MPKLIVFDVGGVLVKLNTAARIAALSLKKSVNGLSAQDDKRLKDANLAYRTGRSTEAEHLAIVADVLGLTHDEIRKGEQSLIEPGAPEMVAFAQELRKTNRVIAFSVTNGLHWDWIVSDILGPDFFDEVYLSHETGNAKPDAASYDDVSKGEGVVSKGEGVAPEDVIFIDDTADNIEAARRHGWVNAIHHVSPADTIALVRELLKA